MNEWDVSTREGFMTCYRSTVRDVYGYAGLLAGADRAAAEDIVREVYIGLLSRARRGDVSAVGFGYLRRAVRHRWIDRWRADRREPEMPADLPVQFLAQLPTRERTVMVLHFVDEMSAARIAEELATTERSVETLVARALRRLRDDGVAHG